MKIRRGSVCRGSKKRGFIRGGSAGRGFGDVARTACYIEAYTPNCGSSRFSDKNALYLCDLTLESSARVTLAPGLPHSFARAFIAKERKARPKLSSGLDRERSRLEIILASFMLHSCFIHADG
jgi:hypothetical protein